MRIRFVLPLFALLLGVAACSQRQPGDSPQAEVRTATLRVQNQAWVNMTMYAIEVGSGARTRLGDVNSTSTATLRIPASTVGGGRSIRIVADPLGSQRTSSSFEIYVRPGETITLTIPQTAGQ